MGRRPGTGLSPHRREKLSNPTPMPSFNKAILAGNLTRDPELKYTPKGTAVCQFGLAINRHWTTESGERREEVTFLDCKAFGRQAEVLGQHLRKGAAVLVEGRIAQEEWDDKATGQKRRATRIVVEAFQFLGSRPAGERPVTDAAPTHTHENPAPAPAPGDDVPF